MPRIWHMVAPAATMVADYMVKLTRETNTMVVVDVVESDWREICLTKDKKRREAHENRTWERVGHNLDPIPLGLGCPWQGAPWGCRRKWSPAQTVVYGDKRSKQQWTVAERQQSGNWSWCYRLTMRHCIWWLRMSGSVFKWYRLTVRYCIGWLRMIGSGFRWGLVYVGRKGKDGVIFRSIFPHHFYTFLKWKKGVWVGIYVFLILL